MLEPAIHYIACCPVAKEIWISELELAVYSKHGRCKAYRKVQMVSQKYFLPFLLFSLLSACATQRPLFDANQVAMNSDERSNLTGKKGTVHATVKTKSIRAAIAAKDKVEKAAGSLRTQFWVDPEEKPNAYAWYNNGQPAISFNVGIFKILGEDEEAYAALVSHELAHLYLDHNAKKLERDGENKTTSMVVGFFLGFAGIPGGGIMTDVANTARETVYSQEDEQEADALGLKYMLQAGYSASGVTHFQERLRIAGADDMLPFLNSHPSGNGRISNMKQPKEIARVTAQLASDDAKPIEQKTDAQENVPSEVLAPVEGIVQ